jgi:hypothetical protein
MKVSIVISQLISGKNIFPDQHEVWVKKKGNYVVSKLCLSIYIIMGKEVMHVQISCSSPAE